MDQAFQCKRCGTDLTTQAVGGLCAACLFKLAVDGDASSSETVHLPGGTESISAATLSARIFGDYELLDVIARGGMGVVYRARQISLNRIVALKMVLAGNAVSGDVAERFRTEAEAVARLEHPNIVPIYEIGSFDGQDYFSMRFLEGGTLTEVIKRERFGTRRAVELLITVARAVHYAHRHGILHRDIKPGNILFDQAGQPYVADFGLAKLLENESNLTQTAAILGTPNYMAPEQAAGNTKQISTAVDVYGLGAVLYELLTKRVPFRGATPVETMRRVVETEPERPRSHNPEVDRDLETICLKCLEKNPAHRYSSAESLANDLEAWRTDRPITARPVSNTERVIKWARRKPIVASLILALHVSALAGLIGILWQARRASNHAAAAGLEAARANLEAAKAKAESRRAENEVWNARFSEARALRSAGGSGARIEGIALLRKLVERPDLSEEQKLDLRNEAIAQMALTDIAMPTNWIEKGGSNPLWQPTGTIHPLAWNSSGTRFLQPTGSNRLDLCEFPSGHAVRSFSGEAKHLDQFILSGNDDFLAARYEDGVVLLWERENSEPILTTQCDGSGFRQRISFSSDGRKLLLAGSNGLIVHTLTPNRHQQVLRSSQSGGAAFTVDSSRIAVLLQNNTIEIIETSSGASICHFHSDFDANRIAWHPDGTRLVLGGDRGKLAIWTLEKLPTGEVNVSKPISLIGHQAAIEKIIFTPDGTALFTYSWDYYSIVWDMVSMKPLLRDPRAAILQADSSSTKLVASTESPLSESVAAFLKPTGFRTLCSIGEGREAFSASTSHDGRLGVVSYNSVVSEKEGECVLWSFSDGKEIFRVPGLWAQFSADGRKLFAFELWANKLVAYDVSVEALTGRSVAPPPGRVIYRGRFGEKVNTGTMAADGRTLVIAATDAVVFFDTEAERPLGSTKWGAHSLQVSDDGKWIATMRHNWESFIWDAETGKEHWRSEVNNHIRFSPDGTVFAVVSLDKLRVCSLNTTRLVHPPIVFQSFGRRPAMEFARDGKFIALVSKTSQVRLHETATGKELATLTPPNPAGPISAIAFSPDGNWLLAAKLDGETIGWNLESLRKELTQLGLNWRSPPSQEERPNSFQPFNFEHLLGYPPRDSSTPGELLDLTPYYNARLNESWHPGTGSSDLAELPRFVQVLGGTQFDVRGLIQVGSTTRGGNSYPRGIEEIDVRRRCERMHFLHSAIMAFDVKRGTELGHYVIFYEDGSIDGLPIIFGRDVADWWVQPNENHPDLNVAWTGENEASRVAGRKIRLFKSTWENPRPNVPIKHLNFHSSHPRAAPFLVAVTVDPPQ